MRGEIDAFNKILTNNKWDLVHISNYKKGGIYYFKSSDRYAKLDLNKNKNTIDVEVFGPKGKVDLILEKFISLITEEPETGEVFIITTGSCGLEMTELGKLDCPFEERNYSHEVTERYHHMVNCLRSNTPCGRLVVLHGRAGTGKSFYIRHLVSEDIKARFVLVPSHMIQELTGTEILGLLVNYVEPHDPKPIVLILEDADEALIHRNKGSLGSLSSLLNLGDGILGELLDVRVIATTNAETINLDDAIQRPGRLCSFVEIKELSKDHIKAIYNRLTGEQMKDPKSMTLAEVYRRARKDGWTKEVKSKSGQYL